MQARLIEKSYMKKFLSEFKNQLLMICAWYVISFASVYTMMFGLSAPKNMFHLFNLVCQAGCYALILASVTFLLGRWKFLLLPLYILIYVIELLEHYLLIRFKTLFGGDLLPMLLNSSWKEVEVFVMDMFSPAFIMWSVLIVIVGYLLTRMFLSGSVRAGILMRTLIFCACAIPFGIYNCVLRDPRCIPYQTTFSFLIADTIKNLSVAWDLYAVSKNPKDERVHIISGDSEQMPIIGVVMIGESMTRNNMSVYGYERNTTPQMNSITNGELFVFRNLLGAWSSTQEALRYLLTEYELGNAGSKVKCIFPEVCRQAGYECALFSNQNHWGAYNTFNSLLFSACKDATWIGDLKTNSKLYDIDMVGLLKEKILSCTDRPLMCFMHLIGSHYPFDEYLDEHLIFKSDFVDKYNKHLFGVDRVLYNDYDNTIYHTDATFGAVVQELEDTHRPAFVLLVSDHGETPRTGKWRVGTDMDLWEIPMVVWISHEFKERYYNTAIKLRDAAGRRLQQDQLLVGMMTLSQIVGYSHYSEERDFLSPKFVARKVRMVQDGRIPYAGDL